MRSRGGVVAMRGPGSRGGRKRRLQGKSRVDARVSRVFSIGIDLGGSRLRLAAVDQRRRVVFRMETPTVPPARLPAALAALWKRRGLRRVPFLTVGSKGVWEERERGVLSRALSPLADRVTVLSDAELALYAAGLKERPVAELRAPGAAKPLIRAEGEDCFSVDTILLLLAGTGSMAIGFQGGRLYRAGGLGPRRGDEGSGFWIGARWTALRSGRSFQELRRERSARPDLVRRTAAGARAVLIRYSRDSAARGLVEDAWIALANLVIAVRRQAGSGRSRLALAGGLFESPSFRQGFRRWLQEAAPGAFQFQPMPRDLAGFAARRAEALAPLATLPRPRRSR